MTSSWKVLDLEFTYLKSPLLLIKYEFGLFHYNVLLTDLTYIWTESLERKQIVKRALTIDTSIDPSESTDQFSLLLRNLQKSLDGAKGTKRSLKIGDTSEQLVLSTSTQLPGSLDPLEWPVYLTYAPQNMLTKELLLPCLSQQFVNKVKIDSLLHILKDKDHVIEKLTDRMQSDGTDLSIVFPGAAELKSKTRRNIRESAAKSVKGLGEFDEEHWRKNLAIKLGSSADLSEIVSRVFLPSMTDELEVRLSNDHGMWWHQTKGKDTKVNVSAIVPYKLEASLLPDRSQKGGSFDSDFQRKITPSRASPLGSKDKIFSTTNAVLPQQIMRLTDANLESTTIDESDGDTVSSKSDNVSKGRTRVSPFTMIGDTSLSPNASSSLRKLNRNEGDGFKSHLSVSDILSPLENHTEYKPASENVLSEPLNSVETIPKPKSKLGRIGGKGRLEKGSGTDNNTMEERPTISTNLTRIVPADLKSEVEKQVSEDVLGVTRLGRPNIWSKSPVAPRENSQERANRKREQLKRELENKSSAALKKKRKF